MASCATALHGTAALFPFPQFPAGVGKALIKPTLSSPRSGKASRTHAFTSLIGSSGGAALRPELDDNPEGIISGEWPENFSLLSYDDLRAYLESHTVIGPCTTLAEVMSTPVVTATAEQTLEEIDALFETVSGLPVLDDELRCVGVVSKSDRARASQGGKSKVGEVMSSPAITLPPNKTIKDAAALMLKMKIHRVPILNERKQVIGIVTRTDVLQALDEE